MELSDPDFEEEEELECELVEPELSPRLSSQPAEAVYTDADVPAKKHYMSESCAPESHAFISRQFAPTSTEMAGSSIIDRRRNVISNIQGYGENLGKFEPASEAIVPLLFHTQDIYQRSGADFGAFRPVISDSEGGYKMTLDEERLCKLVVPYQTAPSLT